MAGNLGNSMSWLALEEGARLSSRCVSRACAAEPSGAANPSRAAGRAVGDFSLLNWPRRALRYGVRFAASDRKKDGHGLDLDALGGCTAFVG